MHFVIAGKVNCAQYSYALMIAQKLKEQLPDFGFMKISKKSEEWDKWLDKVCKENEWYHVKSPLVWREVSMTKGKKYYVGNINEFLDLCRDYYGLPKELLAGGEFEKEEMDWFRKRTESEYFEDVRKSTKDRIEYRCRQVCITGAASPMSEILLMELFQLKVQHRKDGMEIRLYDEPKREKKLLATAADARYCCGPSGLGSCRVVSSLRDALIDVDLVIVLDSFSRRQCESLVKWLKRNRNAMCVLGKALNKYARTHCRVIIGGYSHLPLCYNATVLASFATKLHVKNIVAVTQDLGREMLSHLSKVTKVSLKDMYCPPVWGFVGLNKYVDVRNTLQNHVYKLPGKRFKSTLPQGSEQLEIRKIDCMVRDEDMKELFRTVANRKSESYPRLGRFPSLAKVAAIVDLLKLWKLSEEDGDGEILCLGVYSDGTFGIPVGIYWSQPVSLEKGFWTPFAQYPIPKSADINLHSLFPFSVAACYRTQVTPRIHESPTLKLKEKNKRKFNFEEIEKEVGMPVIRTEIECLSYLKMLTKKELGIDLDQTDIPEGVEPVELPSMEEKGPEKINWCECWRQELKKLQGFIFSRSSTSELEVDLSPNVSGSEWSIINFPTVILPEKSLSVVSIPPEPKSSSPSTITVCDCRPQNGISCQCLKVTEEVEEEPVEFTENDVILDTEEAGVFEEVILYEDVYEKKAVHFHSDIPSDDEKEKSRLKFYGKKDAIRDEEAEEEMERRIRMYEKGSQESSTVSVRHEEGETRESSKASEVSEASCESKSEPGEEEEDHGMGKTRFHVSAEGAAYEILGDPDGLECLEERRRSTAVSGSVESFREMWADKITPELQITADTETTTETTTTESTKESSVTDDAKEIAPVCQVPYTDMNEIDEGEGAGSFILDLPVEEFGELDFDSNEEELMEKGTKDEEEVEKPDEADGASKRKPKKWEGVPRCCLCHCIVPEGLLGCPCGETKVIEVFKKESEEIHVESEEEISFQVEYIRERLSFEVEEEEEKEEILDDEIICKKKTDIFGLPPESFIPFRLKNENKFLPSERPDELSKKFLDTLRPPEEVDGIPRQCSELLKTAEAEFEEKKIREVAELADNKRMATLETAEKEIGNTDKEGLSTIPEESDEELEIKTQFSNLKFATPIDVEDWKTTVQIKYREWFLTGPNIKDESYYDAAIEEASEDEYEVDADLKKYFED